MYHYRFNSMSTIVQISINQELFANDMMPIYQLFELAEKTCSRFLEDSELTLLNTQLGKEVVVSEQMFSILKESKRFFRETDGLFNPGILSSLVNNGYSKSIEHIKGQAIVDSCFPTPVAISDLPFTLNDKSHCVILHTKIDLGGIAKGWVIDQAANLLEKVGYGFINVGGDIRIFGTLPRPLNIGIESPHNALNMISSIQVSAGAVATSTSMKRRWMMNGKWKHHLIDPRTGSTSNSDIISATITASTALEADVWAKTVLLAGEEKGLALINKRRMKTVLINKQHEIWKGGGI